MQVEFEGGPSQEVLAARRELSEKFLNTIVSGIKEGTVSSADDLKRKHALFIDENQGTGSDFDVAHSWRIAELRSSINKQLLEQADERLPDDAVYNEIALSLLEEVVFGIKEE